MNGWGFAALAVVAIFFLGISGMLTEIIEAWRRK